MINSLTYLDDHEQENTYTVNKYGVLSIEQHAAAGEGDKWYYDVIFADKTIRLFSFVRVEFIK